MSLNNNKRVLHTRIPYRIIGGDYSAQEPRLTAFMSQDPAMIKAYSEGQDLYSVIASMSFNRPYEDCLEFYPEGTKVMVDGKEVIAGHKNIKNDEGAHYRSMAKSILLGIEYGRGAKSVGEQIKKSEKEAQVIIDNFFKSFPKVKEFINTSIKNAHELGYVEDVAGRRRHLPDAQLPNYEVKYSEKKLEELAKGDGTFNPFIGCKNRMGSDSNKLLESYRKRAEEIKYSTQYSKLKEEALKDGVEIHNNSGFIAAAEREAVNSRIQGGAASLTKTALISIFNDQRMKDIGAYLINTVHDEILMEVPEYYSKRGEELLVENMIQSAKKWVTNVPMSCDTYNVNCRYIENYFVEVQSQFKNLIEGNPKENIPPVESDPMKAFELLAEDRQESSRSQLYEIVGGMLPQVPQGVDIKYKSYTK